MASLCCISRPLHGHLPATRLVPCSPASLLHYRSAISAASSSAHHDKGGERDETTSKRNEWPHEVNSPERQDAQGNKTAAELRSKVAALGLSAVLAYGLLDGVTYTTFFVLAFLGYEKSTGNNPAANLKALLGIVLFMWTGNNVTRPLRVAGAAALAPIVDRFLKKVETTLKLPNKAFAFMIVVAAFASLCLSVAGLLVLSRWGK